MQPDEEDLPTIPPRIIEQLKVIVATIASVTPDRVDIIATVVEIAGHTTLHVGAEVDGRPMTEEQRALLSELLAEATSAGAEIAALRSDVAMTPSKIVKEIQ